MVDFSDEKQVRAWLEGLPQEKRVAFAARAALRGLPGIAFAPSEKLADILPPANLGDLALLALRSVLIAGVAAVVSPPGIMRRAWFSDNAVQRRMVTVLPHESAAFCAATSTIYAAQVVDSGAPGEATSKAAVTVRYAGLSAAWSSSSSGTKKPPVQPSALAAVYRQYQHDEGVLNEAPPSHDLFSKPLWKDEPTPENVATGLGKLRALWGAEPEVWRFWQRWYDGMLRGEPLPWDLQEQVALIPDDIWQAGPEAVAEEIRERAKRYALSAAREAESYLVKGPDNEDSDLSAMIGHNQPPPDEALPLRPEDLDRLLEVVRSVPNELQSQTPDARELAAQADEIEAAQGKIRAWMASKLDMGVDEFIKAFFKQAGNATAIGLVSGILLWLAGLLELLGPLAVSIRAAIGG